MKPTSTAKARARRSTAKPEPEEPSIVVRSDRICLILPKHVFEINLHSGKVLTFNRESLGPVKA
jgi:hypothetical protein